MTPSQKNALIIGGTTLISLGISQITQSLTVGITCIVLGAGLFIVRENLK